MRSLCTSRPGRRITSPSVPSAGCGPARAAPGPPTRRGSCRYASRLPGLSFTSHPCAEALKGWRVRRAASGCAGSHARTAAALRGVRFADLALTHARPPTLRTPRHSEFGVFASSETAHRVSPPGERPQAASVSHTGGIAAPCPLRGRARRPGRRCRHPAASRPEPPPPLPAVGRSARTRQVGTTPSCLWAAERLDNRLAHLRQHARIRPGGRNRTLPGGKRRNDPRGLLTRPWTAPALVLDTRENRSA